MGFEKDINYDEPMVIVMDEAHFTFISTYENYEKEYSGIKSNHVLEIENVNEKWLKEMAEMIKKKQYGFIKIRKGYTNIYFIRKITDITFWRTYIIISWG